MKIALIAKPGHADSGVGRYVENLAPALQAAGHEVLVIYPAVPLPAWLLKVVKKLLSWDLEAFFLTYPIWISYPAADLYHFTSQNLVTLLFFRSPRGKIVTTVHDLIPRLIAQAYRKSYKNIFEKYMDDLSIKMLERADHIIAVSNHSKSILNTYSTISKNISVIYEGIDH